MIARPATSERAVQPFVYQANASRVVFGAGSVQHLAREIDALGARRALVLCTPGQTGAARVVAELLGDRAAGIFAGAVMHVPIETARAARDEAKRLGADCAVAIGGGSTTGLGKAIALDSGLPIIAIPTTYAGSEMTSIYGLTDAGIKKTGRDARVLPRTVIYDPELSVSLPIGLSVTSGLNAIAHAAEALYAFDGNPITALMAEEGIRAIGVALPKLVVDPESLDARADALYGAWLCGTVLGAVSMGLHHKLCHTLGGMFDLAHAETHAILLPHSLAYNAPAVPDAMASLAATLGHPDPAGALYDLAKDLGAPCGLRELGMPAHGVDTAAKQALANPYWNPRPLEYDAIRRLINAAWAGERPTGSGQSS